MPQVKATETEVPKSSDVINRSAATPGQRVRREYMDARSRWLSTSGIDKKGRYYLTGFIDGEQLPPLPTYAQMEAAAAKADADAASKRKR